MSTDMTYEEANPKLRDKYVSSDKDDIQYVLGKVLQYAKQEFKVMYLFQRNGFYWMTDYPPEYRKQIAKVYPGGRILLRVVR